MYILAAFVFGVIYGFIKPGKENRMKLLKESAAVGILIGIVFGLLGTRLPELSNALALGTGVAIAILVFFFAVFFIIGTAVGDFLENLRKS
ncbi:hypothetical protein Arcve_1193 [Archaeoglobus veneficus SNP6]|uniref:DUF340 domain-containing protein n=2 Tax=Archaeoglobus veneficus TaxID=58290 RepID=F2KMK3_ARCVS|nr:hypothetical protein Arcve_1193 [Archaeoglobus veneficus SNP6]